MKTETLERPQFKFKRSIPASLESSNKRHFIFERGPSSKEVQEADMLAASLLEELAEEDQSRGAIDKTYQFPILTAEQETMLFQAYEKEKADDKDAIKMLKEDNNFWFTITDEKRNKIENFEYAFSQSESAYDMLLNCNMGLAKKYAERMSATRESMDREDLEQEAIFGLKKAIERSDQTKGYRLAAIAMWWIKKSITDSIHTTDRMVSLPKRFEEYISKSRGLERNFVDQQKREPNVEELTELLISTGITQNDAKETAHMYLSRSHSTESLNRPIQHPNGDEIEIGELLPDPQKNTENQALFAIDPLHAFDGLSPADKAVLTNRHIQGMTIEEIAKKHGLRLPRAYEKENKARKKLQELLVPSNIDSESKNSKPQIEQKITNMDKIKKNNRSKYLPHIEKILEKMTKKEKEQFLNGLTETPRAIITARLGLGEDKPMSQAKTAQRLSLYKDFYLIEKAVLEKLEASEKKLRSKYIRPIGKTLERMNDDEREQFLNELTQIQRDVIIARLGLGEDEPMSQGEIARVVDINIKSVGRIEQVVYDRLSKPKKTPNTTQDLESINEQKSKPLNPERRESAGRPSLLEAIIAGKTEDEIRTLMKNLTPEEAALVNNRFFSEDGNMRTQKEICHMMGLSIIQISRKEHRIAKKITQPEVRIPTNGRWRSGLSNIIKDKTGEDIELLLRSLNEDDQKIFSLRLGLEEEDPMSLREVARSLGTSHMHVVYREKAIYEQLTSEELKPETVNQTEPMVIYSAKHDKIIQP